MRLLAATVILVATAGVAHGETPADVDAAGGESKPPEQSQLLPKPQPARPWLSLIRVGAGVDNNIEMSPFGSDPTALTGFDMTSQVAVSRNLRIAMQADYEKNLPSTAAGSGGAGLFAGYLRDLPANFQLRLSTHIEGRQERSVFADGAILTTTTALQRILETNFAGLLAYRLGSIDFEVGLQGDFEIHDGNVESSQLLGIQRMAGIRYSYRDRFALRLRYSYEFSQTKGLSGRNLNGAVLNEDQTLIIGVNRVRVSMRTRITDKSSIFARYDYVTAKDDFNGYLDSREHVGFISTAADWDAVSFDANVEVAHRSFFLRAPTIDNPDTDTTYSGIIRADGWVLPSFAGAKRVGLFALYKLQVVRANPTGLVFARHVGLGGISGRFGSGR
ncbi:MAG: hypothetical protein GY811_13995 [Myxococcales bacterium]|nr:hypothetical protein [Myxococcales bacterium]